MNNITPENGILISETELKNRTAELGSTICRDYAGKNPLLIGILKGCIVFLSDLMREIDLPLDIDFMSVSSYGSSTVSNGCPDIRYDLHTNIRNRHVLIVEDIIDSGNTLFCLRQELLKRYPASLKICTLLDKPSRRTASIQPDYTGFVIDDYFIVGYGLDYNEKFRNQKFISIYSDPT